MNRFVNYMYMCVDFLSPFHGFTYFWAPPNRFGLKCRVNSLSPMVMESSVGVKVKEILKQHGQFKQFIFSFAYFSKYIFFSCSIIQLVISVLMNV